MTFEHDGLRVNILDTPGHHDFSEDTYRTLTAADSAVMLIDAAKGVEPQTRKLFKVCRMRGIPIFTFVNKMDRQGRDPLGTDGRDRGRPGDPRHADQLAGRGGQGVSRCLRPATGAAAAPVRGRQATARTRSSSACSRARRTIPSWSKRWAIRPTELNESLELLEGAGEAYDRTRSRAVSCLPCSSAAP